MRAILKSLQRLRGHQKSSQCKAFLMTYGESYRNHMDNISAEIHTVGKGLEAKNIFLFFSSLPKKAHLRQLEICEKCLVLSLGWVLVSSCLLFPLNLPRACMGRRCQGLRQTEERTFCQQILDDNQNGTFFQGHFMRQSHGSLLVFPL